MNQLCQKIVLALSLVVSVLPVRALAQPDAQPANATLVHTNQPTGERYIVRLREGADVDGFLKEFKLKPRHQYRHALHGFAMELDATMVERLKREPRILDVEPDGHVVLCSQTPSTGFIRMGVSNFPVAHINGQDNRINVDVAVLDTGIQLDHPDLNVVQGVDITGSGQNGNDNDGHGTHVAGIIGALDNDIGVVGVAPGVRLWSVQVFDTNGIGYWSYVIAGMEWILTNADKIEVVNASLSSDGSATPYAAIHQAVTNLVNQGIVFVAGAGNGSQDISATGLYGNPHDIVPAAFPEVMAVSAMNPVSNLIAYFSDYSSVPHNPSYVNAPGAGIDLAEPGVDILSTYTNSGYATLTGTSMSCGFASGLVALYIAANGRATNAQGVYAIRQALINSSLPQSQWGVPYTYDPDGNLEPLGVPSASWLPPALTSAVVTTNGFQFSFFTDPLFTDSIQFTSALSDSNQWTGLTSVIGTGSNVTVLDAATASSRFYRLVRTPPAPAGVSWSTLTTGTNLWFLETNVTYAGTPAFQSGAEGNTWYVYNVCALNARVVGPGTLTFVWKVSSTTNQDFLSYYLDNAFGGVGFVGASPVPIGQISGEVDWQPQSYSVPTGVHQLVWTYSKQSNGSGQDAGWVDQVVYTPGGP